FSPFLALLFLHSTLLLSFSLFPPHPSPTHPTGRAACRSPQWNHRSDNRRWCGGPPCRCSDHISRPSLVPPVPPRGSSTVSPRRLPAHPHRPTGHKRRPCRHARSADSLGASTRSSPDDPPKSAQPASRKLVEKSTNAWLMTPTHGEN